MSALSISTTAFDGEAARDGGHDASEPAFGCHCVGVEPQFAWWSPAGLVVRA